MKKKFVEVAINGPFNESILTYTYEGEEPKRGQLFYAPLGKRKVKSCVLKTTENSNLKDDSKIKNILDPYEWNIQLSEKTLDFFEWIANYYQYPLGQLIFDILPRPLKRPRKLQSIKGSQKNLYKMSPLQEGAWLKIKKGLGSFNQFLVHGVTGSGKSILYFKSIQKIIENKRSILFLLPEINLTPQFEEDIKNSINAPIYSYHSGLSASDKFGLWNILKNSTEPVVIIGVRSSIFLPVENLGLIIVDEEHDNSFKQEDRCPYNARDLALKLGHLNDVPVLLGSATPSMESFSRFQKENLIKNYLCLKERFGEGRLPIIKLLDARKFDTEKKENSNQDQEVWPFLNEGLELMQKHLEKKEQVLVFVNRLGFASYVQCRSCGHQFFCPNCSVPLKFFKKKRELSCQTCEYKESFPDECPECGNLKLLQMGFGTEKLEEVLRKKFPQYNIGRFDRDDITTLKQLEQRLDDFHAGKIDILIGTQMMAKGHNFEKVNLVLILGADGQLNFPDFRSAEKVYQLLTQISGRAGRYGNQSEVVIQSLSPENKIFSYIQEHSFDSFYENELEVRKLCQCPPFSHLIMIYFTSKFQKEAINSASMAMNHFENLSSKFPKVDSLGPRPSFIEKRVNKFTWTVMLRSSDRNQLHNSLKTFKSSSKNHYSVSIKIDIDPYHIS